jgi:Fe-S cluster assembly protein SufD
MSAAAEAAAPTLLAAAAEAFLSRYDGFRVRLPGPADVRADAAEMFRARGLPTVREEAWRYTNLRPLAEVRFGEALTSVGAEEQLLARLPRLDGPRIVCVDGRYRADLSSLPRGVAVESFSKRPDFGSVARPDRDRLVALNTMLAEDGVWITVPAGFDAGVVQLASLGDASPARPIAFHPRHTVRLSRGARMTLVEVACGQGVYLHNPVMTVQVAEDATLTHVRLQNEAPKAFQLSTVYAVVAERGTYDSFTLNLGARLCRSEIHARLTGPGGMTHLNGAQLLGGAQHGDITTVVSHDAPCCGSRQTVKNVLDGRARGVFQGRIEVARAAQKTDGYQMNQALLLSPDAEIDSKPQLEIFADDVKCSHGATVGELDAAQLFYLRSRGVPEQEARTMLVRAFLTEALDAVADERVRDMLDTELSAWWERQAA